MNEKNVGGKISASSNLEQFKWIHKCEKIQIVFVLSFLVKRIVSYRGFMEKFESLYICTNFQIIVFASSNLSYLFE